MWGRDEETQSGAEAGQVPGVPSGKECCPRVSVEELVDRASWGEQVRLMILIKGHRQARKVGW